MILQSLLEYYEILADKGAVPRTGWSTAKVSFAINISEEGELLYILPLFEEIEDKKKKRTVPKEMVVPEQVKRSSGVAPNFLCDSCAYLLGIDNKGKKQRAMECFAASARYHKEILGASDNPLAKAICLFYSRWNAEEAEDSQILMDFMDEIKKASTLVFRVGNQFAHNDEEIKAIWQSYCRIPEDTESKVCLVTGQKASPARLHPNIKGVMGAQTAGAALVSFNADAYNSYGKEQGNNAAVSKYAAFAYGTALNKLISTPDNHIRLGDMTIVFWAKTAQQEAADFFSVLMGAKENEMTGTNLKKAMERIANGKPAMWEDVEISPDTPFYILGISPNAARLSVRFFISNSFGVIANRLMEHQKRLEITRPAFDQRDYLSFWALLNETVNKNSRDKSPSSVMAGEVVRAVLNGERYPASLLNGVILRIRAEHEVTRGRAAIIKAYYLKNTHPGFPKEVLTVEKNENTNDVPYNMGALFSVLEEIQEKVNPQINTTIKDKYFNSASATPSTIFPIIIALSQNHLKKMEKRNKIYFDSKLTKILGKIDNFPTRMTLPEQGRFVLGYYHEKQKRFEKKEDIQDEKGTN